MRLKYIKIYLICLFSVLKIQYYLFFLYKEMAQMENEVQGHSSVTDCVSRHPEGNRG